MFEQSVVQEIRKPWSFLVSLTMECSVVAALLFVSIWRVDSLDVKELHQPLRAPFIEQSLKDRAVEVVSTVRETTASALNFAARKVFTAPSRVPTEIAQINDLDAGAPLPQSVLQGVPSSTGFGPVIGIAQAPVAAAPPATQLIEPAGKKSMRVSLGVMEAKILRRVMPVYPQLARQARISGKVRLLGVIATDGSVQKLEVLQGHPLLIGAALDAVKQWLYQPTLLNGQPVEVVTPIEVNFTLQP